ncbi:MAG TPA: hypothetical protein VEP90_15885 [Methylomirabilota bacterium]|nr:hypothetical protein [Methylomirabilota bacterium]
MNYDKYHFIKPCRAEQPIPPNMLQLYENRNWLAQYKMNGTNSLIFVSDVGENGGREITFRTRHDTAHKLWQFSDASMAAFEEMPTNGWYVFNTELLHSKTPHIKDTNFIHDILVYDSKYLVGSTYHDRYELLHRIFKPLHTTWDGHWCVDSNTWIAQNYYRDFELMFYSLHSLHEDEKEGLILKNPSAILDMKSSSNWLVKCKRKQ